MLDLSERAGLPLWLDAEQLRCGENVVIEETKVRTRGELAPVALDPQACVPADAIQYWMYNGVARREDLPTVRGAAARYELTLMLPHALGRERVKTLGHIHNAPVTGAPGFPEMFQVIYGSAHFFFYTLGTQKAWATFCGWLGTREGDQIVMPPNCYHLTINAGDAPLLFADVISRRAFGLYDDVRATHGAPYFETTAGEWLRNPAFEQVARLEEYSILLLNSRTPLYAQFVHDPAAFDWVDEPAQFWKKCPRLQSVPI